MNEKQRKARRRMFLLSVNKQKLKLKFKKGRDRIKEETTYVKPCGECECERELRNRR